MKNPALKGEVSINKMLTTLNPRLRRTDVMFNSFSSCIPNTPKELPWTPKVSFSEVLPQPGVLSHKLKGTVSLKQLKSSANTHVRGKLNKQMHMVNSDVKLIDFTTLFDCNFVDKPFTIHLEPVKLKGVHCIFNFPDKMESILPEAMFKTFQIHFSSPEDSSNYLRNLFQEGNINPLHTEELNINKEDGNSSLCLKAEVSLPWM